MGMTRIRPATAADCRKLDQPDRCCVTLSPSELLESVWNEIATDLARTVSALGIPRDFVDDVLQDVYLTALQRLPEGMEHDKLRPWLFRVTINRCKLEHRRGKRWKRVWDALATWLPNSADGRVEHSMQQRDERRIINSAIEHLDRDSKVALVLRYYVGLDSTEIGEVMQCPHSTVRSRLRRARQTLAASLEEAGFDET